MSLHTEIEFASAWAGTVPQAWQMRGKYGTLVRLEPFKDEHEAQAYVSGWNDATATFGNIPAVYSITSPEGRRWFVGVKP